MKLSNYIESINFGGCIKTAATVFGRYVIKIFKTIFYMAGIAACLYATVNVYHMRIYMQDLYDNIYYVFPHKTKYIET
jgi:hypothetical protein